MSKIKTATTFFAVVALLLSFCVFMTACYEGYREITVPMATLKRKRPSETRIKKKTGATGS